MAAEIRKHKQSDKYIEDVRKSGKYQVSGLNDEEMVESALRRAQKQRC